MKHHVIYVPGLGDDYWKVQGLLIRLWYLGGIMPHLFEMKWADCKTFAGKLDALLTQIDKYVADGHKVSLVGASAGASAILMAYAARKQQINAVVCICGKINRPETISDRTYNKNPTFKESMLALRHVLLTLSGDDKARILSIHPVTDNSVPIADTIIVGATERQISTSGHSLSILAALSFFAPITLRFIKGKTAARL